MGRQQGKGGEKFRQQAMDFGPNCPGHEFPTGRGNPGGDDVARIHLMHRCPLVFKQGLQPLPLYAQRVEIRHRQGRLELVAEMNHFLARLAAAQDERNPRLGQCGGRTLQTLEEKIELAQGSTEKPWGHAEHHRQGNLPPERLFPGMDEAPVVLGTKFTVHPIDDRSPGVAVAIVSTNASWVCLLLHNSLRAKKIPGGDVRHRGEVYRITSVPFPRCR